MADIYSGALLTIMAASASDGTTGIFGKRTLKHDMVRVPYTDEVGKTTLSVYITSGLPQYYMDITNGPLFTRAWVFQERLLSKRKLIFGHKQSYWDCNGSILSESRSEGEETNSTFDKSISTLKLFANPHIRIVDDGDLSDQIHTMWPKLWYTVVKTYSECSLTYETDRLPSLSGLARVFAQISGHTYAAGLWLEQMPDALLWKYYTPRFMAEGEEYCAPSWSWASAGGRCEFLGERVYYKPLQNASERKRCVPELEVLSSNMILASTDTYGKVASGSSLIVKGRLRMARLDKTANEREYEWICEAIIRDEAGNYLGEGELDQETYYSSQAVVCLEVTSPSHFKSDSQDRDPIAHFLVLQATGNELEYRRIGFVWTHHLSAEEYPFVGVDKTVLSLV
ncbi:hypothetical protein ACN47E_001908 [Coniothyrium glycines]